MVREKLRKGDGVEGLWSSGRPIRTRGCVVVVSIGRWRKPGGGWSTVYKKQ